LPELFYYRIATVGIDDDGLTALRLGKNRMRQPFFDDQPESEPVSNLGQKIGDKIGSKSEKIE
jgi:hypothetical protein